MTLMGQMHLPARGLPTREPHQSSFHDTLTLHSVWHLSQQRGAQPNDEQLTSEEIKMSRQGIPARNSDVEEGNIIQFLKQSSVLEMKK
jgi:hypothetical protein